MTDIGYLIVPEDENDDFTAGYVPDEDDPGDFDEHPDIPEDLSAYDN